MKTISLKIEEEIFEDTEKILSEIKKSRNRYINEAIEYYNTKQQRELLEVQFARESKMGRKESMKVLRDFEEIDHED